jgi:hypothetical protein
MMGLTGWDSSVSLTGYLLMLGGTRPTRGVTFCDRLQLELASERVPLMPREIVTVQLGQCGNQSGHLT